MGDKGKFIINQTVFKIKDRVVSVLDNHVFVDDTARDAYFTANPGEKTKNLFISSGGILQQWNGVVWNTSNSYTKGDKGDKGVGVPTGGTTGQKLRKKSATDFDTEWASDSAGGVVTNSTATGTITPDFSAGDYFNYTLTGNITLAVPTNMVAGTEKTFLLKQDATGNRTITYNTNYLFASGTDKDLSTTAGAVDLLTVKCIDGTTMQCSLLKKFV